MTVNPEERPVIEEMHELLRERITPHIEHIQYLKGHTRPECVGWKLDTDKDGEDRFRCGCGGWLDSKEEAEDAGDEWS